MNLLSRIDGLPPHSMEAEQCVLGTVLTDQDAVHACIEAGFSPDWFYDLRHREIWLCCLAMASQRKPVDMISIATQLKEEGQLEGIGGMAYLAELADIHALTNAAIPYHIEILGANAMRRRLIAASIRVKELAADTSADPTQAVEQAEAAILSIRSEFDTSHELTMKQRMRQTIDDFQDRVQNGDKDRIKTHFHPIDRITKGGFRPGQMVVIAARPSMGKTSLAVTMMRSMAAGGVACGLISLEMTQQEICDSMVAQEADVEWDSFGPDNKPSQQDVVKLTAAFSRISKMPIFIRDTLKQGKQMRMTVSAISAISRRWVRKDGVKMIFIDYLQRITADSSRADRREQVDQISNSVKGMALELGVPVVVLAQLNREFEKDKARKPKLSDLREAGGIEADADFVGMLYSPDPEDMVDPDPASPIRVNMYVAKQRKGIRFIDIPLLFKRSTTRFEGASRPE